LNSLNVTPVRKWQFILGKLLPFWLLSLVIVSIGLVVGKLAFSIPIAGDLETDFGVHGHLYPLHAGSGISVYPIFPTAAATGDVRRPVLDSSGFVVLVSGRFTPLGSNAGNGLSGIKNWSIRSNTLWNSCDLSCLKGAGFRGIFSPIISPLLLYSM
jgi:ABC-2 type transport system permease protein